MYYSGMRLDSRGHELSAGDYVTMRNIHIDGIGEFNKAIVVDLEADEGDISIAVNNDNSPIVFYAMAGKLTKTSFDYVTEKELSSAKEMVDNIVALDLY